ncbi:hypothetical protein OHC33_007546 [Knufia fluminis]|uniref:FAD binding domain-containing protein n=1 Tax=Knufia fluminis TaxID=191047 RepID=A0AAN8EDB5_9EURO|nr:hypothetical protein OHC33_007546 [Knufia fluminis]
MAPCLPSDKLTTDTLIIGAGPSGLFTALLLLRYGISDVTIIDKYPIRTLTGHASGLQPRTLEILHTLGLKSQFDINAGGVADTAFWAPKDQDSGISRASAAPEVTNPTIYKRLIIQHQGRTEEVLNAELEKLGHHVKRPFEFLDYEYTEDKDHPVCAYVKDIARGQVQQYHCRYLIGADGANSVTRAASKIESTTHETSDSWLVADCAIKTDFPDIRRRCAIRTPAGNLMLIPSPRNTIRIYMLITNKQDLQDLAASKLDDLPAPLFKETQGRTRTTPLEILLKRLPPILKPYTIQITHIDWISKYVVGQKVIKSFTDNRNVLFVGDACHSHSPKAAQGMNTGIQDAYNLAWKLALILKGRANPSLLETYNSERCHIANQLIDFDTKFAKLFGDQSALNSGDFEKTWKEAQGFTSGLAQEYPAGPLVVPLPAGAASECPCPLIPGQRLAPMSLIRHIDRYHLTSLDTMASLGHFNEVVFAGDISREPRKSEFRRLYEFLTSPGSVLTKYNGLPPEGQDGWLPDDIFSSPPLPLSSGENGKVMNLYVVHTASRFDVELRPDFELWKWNFFEDEGGREHRMHGVETDGPIRVAIVRPDGIVGMVRDGDGGLGREVHRYFGGFMK